LPPYRAASSRLPKFQKSDDFEFASKDRSAALLPTRYLADCGNRGNEEIADMIHIGCTQATSNSALRRTLHNVDLMAGRTLTAPPPLELAQAA
jgi:hypothetical protein